MVTQITKNEISLLLDEARQVRENAYAPYSRFKVGAALLGSDGIVYTGCNVENVSYGLTNCAERTAFFKAVSLGQKKFKAIAIFADTDEFCFPCGACRQVMAEFGDLQVIQFNRCGEYVINTVAELLPGSFHVGIPGKEMVE
ncbi:cytidine deaminase [Phosphitispora sp. TUW77]|uniref:cytidine deaminase n=1 Tax=Phosphitispora sp. TUW77 TaxID=3152361 RepID=UPI003AB5267A